MMATALALSLVGSACGQEEGLQVIQGTVMQSILPFETTTAIAIDAPFILSASHLSSGGRFNLAVPASDSVTLALSTPQGVFEIFADSPLKLCNPGLPIDLGMIHGWVGDPSCEESAACIEADMALAVCIANSEQVCRGLFESVLSCREARDTTCEPFREMLNTCMMEQPTCEGEVLALFDCESQFDCQPIENDYFETCDQPCELEAGTQQMACSNMTGDPCIEPPTSELFPTVPLPPSIGCNEGNT